MKGEEFYDLPCKGFQFDLAEGATEITEKQQIYEFLLGMIHGLCMYDNKSKFSKLINICYL